MAHVLVNRHNLAFHREQSTSVQSGESGQGNYPADRAEASARRFSERWQARLGGALLFFGAPHKGALADDAVDDPLVFQQREGFLGSDVRDPMILRQCLHAWYPTGQRAVLDLTTQQRR